MSACIIRLPGSTTAGPSTRVETWVRVLRHTAMRQMLLIALSGGLLDQAIAHHPLLRT
jgi:hypothetical protein